VRRRLREGAVVFVVAALSIADFFRIDSTSHSASDTLVNWVPQTALLVLVGWVLMRLVSRLRAR